MVQLKEKVEWYKARTQIDFNSNMVQLKELNPDKVVILLPFQFQYGTIKR